MLTGHKSDPKDTPNTPTPLEPIRFEVAMGPGGAEWLDASPERTEEVPKPLPAKGSRTN